MSTGDSGGSQTPTSSLTQQHHQLQNHGSHSSSDGGGLFFADATLDLDEAHDIAETPEPPRRFLQVDPKGPISHANLRLPQLDLLPSTGPGTLGLTNSGTINRSVTLTTSPQSAAVSPTNTAAEGPSSSRSLNAPMNRITNTRDDNHPHSNGHVSSERPRFRQRPRWPRDLPWAVAFCVMLPVGLIWPSLLWHRQNIFGMPDYKTMTPLALPVLRHATFWSVLLAYASTLLLARGLYRTPGGGEGDDLRYKASQFLLACVPMSVAMNVILVLAVYFLLPRALLYALIPLWYLIRDVYLFRRWKMQGSGGAMSMDSPNMNGGPSSAHSSQPNSTRHAFFQALTCMALDILSRSLRRNSFHRCIVTLLTLQVLVAMVWRWAIMGALNTGNPVTVILALVGGKWATGTIARLLSLIASGGVASWFAENAAMEELEMQEANDHNKQSNRDDEEGGYETSDIPEAYRTADASIYQSVLDFEDDGIEDDDQDAFEYGFSSRSNNSIDEDDYNRAVPRHGHNNNMNLSQKATVKSFFLSGIGVSFGSVAQCGLLGGPAQFVWCQLRKVDATRTAIVHRLQQQPRDFQPNRAVSMVMGVAGVQANGGGFRGMQIGQNSMDGTSVLQRLLNKGNVMARAFVRSHSDLAMSHVAAYYKSYKRAALDVSHLVEQAGTYSNGSVHILGLLSSLKADSRRLLLKAWILSFMTT
jgi:hypothetical protein